jgi:hypothetical protein
MINKFINTALLLLLSTVAFAQHQHETPTKPEEKSPPTGHQHGHNMMDMKRANPASNFLMSEGAGTAVNPGSGMMNMSMNKMGDWNFMMHGYAFLNFIHQSGPRGNDDLFSTNHLMLMAERQPNSHSSFLLRAMFSLEPATMNDGKYSLLFQTGETVNGRPLVDGQHPHDLFMDLSAQYAIQLNPDILIHFYGALRGDPALGPVAYPHRVSAQELPQAALSHHLQDSTHIVDDVLTAGLKYKTIRLEVSGFHGAEPDSKRWDLDPGAIDSWSTRFTYTPSNNIVGQISTGRLKHPEELEPGDIQRTTASVTYNQTRPDGFWATSFIWGWNHKIEPDVNLYSYLFETLWQFRDKNYLTGRIEFVDKDELFANHDEQSDVPEPVAEIFNIKAFTIGYARDFDLIPGFGTGFGANVTFYATPSELDPFYGKNPNGFLVYFRVRLGKHGQH